MDDRELDQRLTKIYDEIVACRIDIDLLKEQEEQEIEAERERLREEGEKFEDEEETETVGEYADLEPGETPKEPKIIYKEQQRKRT